MITYDSFCEQGELMGEVQFGVRALGRRLDLLFQFLMRWFSGTKKHIFAFSIIYCTIYENQLRYCATVDESRQNKLAPDGLHGYKRSAGLYLWKYIFVETSNAESLPEFPLFASSWAFTSVLKGWKRKFGTIVPNDESITATASDWYFLLIVPLIDFFLAKAGHIWLNTQKRTPWE